MIVGRRQTTATTRWRADRGRIALEDFQVHGMTCRATVIELHAWTSRHVVDIADLQRPTITSGPKPAGPGPGEQLGLGHWSKESVIDLQGEAQLASLKLFDGIFHETID